MTPKLLEPGELERLREWPLEALPITNVVFKRLLEHIDAMEAERAVLAHTFNQMIEGLKERDRLRQLAAGLAHELHAAMDFGRENCCAQWPEFQTQAHDSECPVGKVLQEAREAGLLDG